MNDKSGLSRFLTDKLMVWAANPHVQWVVATDCRHKLHLCEGVKMRPRKMRGKEVARGGPRRYRNSSSVIRRWTEDHLDAQKAPKLACILSGAADLPFYDYELNVRESTFLFIPPNVPQPDGSVSHVRPDNPTGSCEICWIMPRGDKLQFWICRSEGQLHAALQSCNVLFLNQQLNLYFRLLYEEVLLGDSDRLSLIPQVLHLLMAGLQREAFSGDYLQFGQDAHPSWHLETSADPIAQAHDYIGAHYGSVITLEGLARIVGMSRSLFAQRFKEQTGQTVGEYLTARRLQKAKDLLRQSEWTVSTISEFVGFQSPNYFCNLFRRHEKCSPMEFRKLHQNQLEL